MQQLPTYDLTTCRQRWIDSLAPKSHDLRTELVREAAEYFGITPEDVARRLQRPVKQLAEEWRTQVPDPTDPARVIDFYNTTDTEIFELLGWHATDDIHLRSVICSDLARLAPGTRVLDYGCGIGSDAIVFGRAGFSITLADVAEPMLRYASWRCRRHGLFVRTLDLKRETPEPGSYDVAICFDVLEHIRQPVTAVRAIRDALRPGGLLFLHAPFGEDPERPMHLAHSDTVTPWMRTLGFHSCWELENVYPRELWGPKIYERVTPSWADCAGYWLQDVCLPPPVGAQLAALYRVLTRRRPGSRLATRNHDSSPAS